MFQPRYLSGRRQNRRGRSESAITRPAPTVISMVPIVAMGFQMTAVVSFATIAIQTVVPAVLSILATVPTMTISMQTVAAVVCTASVAIVTIARSWVSVPSFLSTMTPQMKK